MGTGHHSSVDRLGQGGCGLEHAKNNTRLHTGFPSCSLAGLGTSPSHQDTSREPSEGEDEEADADGEARKCWVQLSYGRDWCIVKSSTSEAWFGEQLNVARAQ